MMGISPERLDWTDSFLRGSSSENVPSWLDGGAIRAAFYAAHHAMTPAWETLTDVHVVRCPSLGTGLARRRKHGVGRTSFSGMA
jgi:hypothetical protein